MIKACFTRTLSMILALLLILPLCFFLPAPQVQAEGNIAKGDRVYYRGGNYYYDSYGSKPSSSASARWVDVTSTAKSNKYKYHINALGWTNDVIKPEVTFVNWDGTVLKRQPVSDKAYASAPAVNPTRPGHTFTGWSPSNFAQAYKVDTTVTAQFTINKYTVTFKDWDGRLLSTQTVNYGGSATPPNNLSRIGHTLIGWEPPYSNITADTTVTAQYRINSFLVTFKDWNGSTLITQTVNYGSSATAPDTPIRVGYISIGWDRLFSNITSDLTVTALYDKKTDIYTVTFKDYDGSVYDEQKVVSGDSPIKPPDPVRAGYTFIGWLPSDYSLPVYNDRTITAIYDTKSYTVQFLDDDGKTELEAQKEVDFDEFKKAPDKIPAHSREGFTFTGWDTQFDGGVWKFIAQYAKESYTVTFIGIDEKMELKKQAVNYGESATPPVPPKEDGFYFDHWDITFDNIIAPLVVRAIYNPITYTVTFLDLYGMPLGGAQNVNHGGSPIPPSAPALTGLTFINWDKPVTNITADTTIKAQYVEQMHEVTFYVGDTVISTQSIRHGKPAIEPETPTMLEQSFRAWSTDFSNIVEDTKVEALWSLAFQAPVDVVFSTILPESKYGEYKLSGGEFPPGVEVLQYPRSGQTEFWEIYGIPSQPGEYSFTLKDSKSGETEYCDIDVFEDINNAFIIAELLKEETEGNYQQSFFTNKDAVLKSECKFEEFVALYVDGKKLREIDDYYCEEGSTKITIKAQTMKDDIGTGSHTFCAEFREKSTGTLQTSACVIKVEESAPTHQSKVTAQTASVSQPKSNPVEATDTEPVAPVAPVAPAAIPTRYYDVALTDWFYEPVQYVSDKGLMIGTDRRAFSPRVAMTRTMLVTVLYRLEGEPAGSSGSGIWNSEFRDIVNDSWYYNAVLWAAGNGIVEGYSNGAFGSNDPVTREQTVAFLYRYAKLKEYDVSAQADLSLFTDLGDISDWALDAFKWAVAKGIIHGRKTTEIAPKGISTRAEVSTIIQRFSSCVALSRVALNSALF